MYSLASYESVRKELLEKYWWWQLIDCLNNKKNEAKVMRFYWVVFCLNSAYMFRNSTRVWRTYRQTDGRTDTPFVRIERTYLKSQKSLLWCFVFHQSLPFMTTLCEKIRSYFCCGNKMTKKPAFKKPGWIFF